MEQIPDKISDSCSALMKGRRRSRTVWILVLVVLASVVAAFWYARTPRRQIPFERNAWITNESERLLMTESLQQVLQRQGPWTREKIGALLGPDGVFDRGAGGFHASYYLGETHLGGDFMMPFIMRLEVEFDSSGRMTNFRVWGD